MIKKIFTCFLLFCIVNFMYLPASAEEADKDYNKSHIIEAIYKTEFNANKASKGQIIQFESTEDCKIGDTVIPSGTIFNGEVKHFKKGRWGYRRAKAVIIINKMILPDGQTYKIKASTKRHVLKGSAIANVGKGVVSFPVAIVVGTTGAVVMIVEAVSIVGLLLIGPTSYAIGRAMGKLTHGINYKKHEGDEIKLKIKSIESNN